MPYKSEAQAHLMRAVAHNPSFAKKVGIPQSVGQKFEAHKAEGGPVKDSMMKKIFSGKETPSEERKEKGAAKKAGMTYGAAERKFEGEKFGSGTQSRADLQSINKPETHRGKMALFSKGGDMKTKRMAGGGMAATKMGKVTAGGSRPHGEHTVQQKGLTKAKMPKMAGSMAMKRGGKC